VKRFRKLSRIGAFAAGCALFGFAHSAAATDPAYLAEFPEPKRITQDFTGADKGAIAGLIARVVWRSSTRRCFRGGRAT